MPQSIMLICPKEASLRCIRDKIKSRWPCDFFREKNTNYLNVFDHIEGGLRVSFNKIKEENIVLDDYKENENLPDSLRSDLYNKKYYLVTFNDFRFASKVIFFLFKEISIVTRDVWVDNDYGIIFSLSDMLERYKNNPDWDWRKVS